ncbi:hypothetical protein, partial [Dyella japonica]|uniref:hypothetical protein n=1 Tax=Dyella japonica TaxID=231455 RepID=UPI00138EF96F
KKAVNASSRDFNLKQKLEYARLLPHPLVFLGQGDTGHWLKIRNRHSEEFRQADLKAQRQISALVVANGSFEKIDKDMLDDINMRAFCKLVASWSFEEECNEDNLMEFFNNNPFAYDDINRLAAQDSLFF